ncbi:MAG TPA: alpha/beta hydrolase [Acidimicrobiales bacterium]|nr:alpha/beta hydrolase [Acidimicrobiales bacterium]
MTPPTEVLSVPRPGAVLAGERRGRSGPVVIMLHEGVADRRSWRAVAETVAERAVAVSYDRRGFGETAPSTDDFSHVDDLLAVADALSGDPVVLAGTSAGAGVALDAAIVAPGRVAGLLLLSPAVSGAPQPSLDADTARFDRLLDEAAAAGDLDEVNRLETWLWLDGPRQPEGRVGGESRALALEMNGIALRNGVPEGAGRTGVDAWNRLGEVGIPATVACGDLDVPFLLERSEELARRLPNAVHRILPGVAHLSELEQPATVAALLEELLGRI